MRIDNGVYRSIKVDWSDITLPLKAGTPMALDGTISNDADAIGLVPQDVIEATVQLPEYIYILVGGEVYLPEVETLSGLELDDAALSAMGGIRFYLDDIHVYGGNGGGSGGGLVVLGSDSDSKLSYNGNVINRNQFEELYNNNAILFFRWETSTNSFFGYVNSYDTVEYTISVILIGYNLGNDTSEWMRWQLYYDSTDDYWYTD